MDIMRLKFYFQSILFSCRLLYSLLRPLFPFFLLYKDKQKKWSNQQDYQGSYWGTLFAIASINCFIKKNLVYTCINLIASSNPFHLVHSSHHICIGGRKVIRLKNCPTVRESNLLIFPHIAYLGDKFNSIYSIAQHYMIITMCYTACVKLLK